MKREAPFDIPAGGTAVIDCTLKPPSPGPFEAQLHVFVDDLGVRETVLKVRGMARFAAARPSPTTSGRGSESAPRQTGPTATQED